MSQLAIVGTGVAGLGCAHFLQHDFDLTLFEQNAYVGGHSNTVTVPELGTGKPLPIDTGFMVYNEVTYPNLTRLFGELGVVTQPTDMSFSVHHRHERIEFCGSSLNHLFSQRRNLLRPRFWKMLAAINRFNAEAVAALDDPRTRALTLQRYVEERGYGEDFFNLYLVPMSSAVWSTPPALMLTFPAATLLRFFHNHGFLGLHTQHPWRTVTGGAKSYVQRLSAPWRNRIEVQNPVVRIERGPHGPTVTTSSGERRRFDHVVLACHADQALRLLADPTPQEQRILQAFRYQTNIATLHTDRRVMPRHRLTWASWNYDIASGPAGASSTATHYWMNRLQGVSDREDYFVTIDRPEAIDPARILKQITYEHPLFSLEAIEAQRELPQLNRQGPDQAVSFCGSYFGYGFHEDAFTSAVNLARGILRRDPWTAAKPTSHLSLAV